MNRLFAIVACCLIPIGLFAAVTEEKTEYQKEIEYLQKKIELLKELDKLEEGRPGRVGDADLKPVLDKLDQQMALLKIIEAKIDKKPDPDPIPINTVVDITFLGPRNGISADANLLVWLKASKVEAYELVFIPAEGPFMEIAKKVGTPCFVLRDADKKVLYSAKTTNVTDIMAAINKFHQPAKKSSLMPREETDQLLTRIRGNLKSSNIRYEDCFLDYFERIFIVLGKENI